MLAPVCVAILFAACGGGNAGGDDDDDDSGSQTLGPECSTAKDCPDAEAYPEDCAEAFCDEGICRYRAKDRDGDGYRDAECVSESVYLLPANDCDDRDPKRNPEAWDGPADEDSELEDGCDGRDTDCDEEIDEEQLPSGATCTCEPEEKESCYWDPDGSTLDIPRRANNENVAVPPCKLGIRECASNGRWGPCLGAVGARLETCDGIDNDCNGEIDDGIDSEDQIDFYCDADNDGYLPEDDADWEMKTACEEPDDDCGDGAGRWIPKPLQRVFADCNDNDPTVNPGQIEVCNGVDDDCDEVVDGENAVGASEFFCDADGDGRLFEDRDAVTGVVDCGEPETGCDGDWVRNPGSSFFDDCDDTDAERYPGYYYEKCDGKDNNCNEEIDEEEFLTNAPVSVGTTFACTYGDDYDWTVTTCPSDAGDCDGIYINACETPLRDNPDHCGGCDVSCDLTCVGLACDDIVEVVAGGSHACGIRESGKVVCWGDNRYGQLGDRTTFPRPTPVEVGVVSNVEALAAGANHTCALEEDGDLYCWGGNSYGQTGRAPVVTQPHPERVSVSGQTIKQVAAGSRSTCVIAEDESSSGNVWCWGANDLGQLGNGSVDGVAPDIVRYAPQRVLAEDGGGQISNATSIAVGNDFACAVRVGGTVVCWGTNEARQLGDGVGNHSEPGCSVDCSPTAVITADLSDAIEVSIGCLGSHACSRAASGVYCWGFNPFGQAVPNDDTPVQVPTTTLPLATDQVAAGTNHSCALLDGAIQCWGSNLKGQLGRGDIGEGDFPAGDVIDSTGASFAGASNVALGEVFGCAVRESGPTFCWGSDEFTQLGDGNPAMDSNVPVKVSRL